jgi:two-component system LytT family response regulator
MSIRALIIEDEPKAQSLLQRILALYCPQIAVVGIASNVADAKWFIADQRPELVFLDVHLHGENGLFLLEYAQSLGLDFTCVITSANHEFRTVSKNNPHVFFLLKPIQISELLSILDEVH